MFNIKTSLQRTLFIVFLVLNILCVIVSLSGCSVKRRVAYDAWIGSDLKLLNTALVQYASDNEESFPVFDNAIVAKAKLYPYTKNDSLFINPKTHEPFQPNVSLSGRKQNRISNPNTVITYYEAKPDNDGKRLVVYLNGSVRKAVVSTQDLTFTRRH